MPKPVTQLRRETAISQRDTVVVLAERLARQTPQLAQRVVDLSRREIVDYQVLSDSDFFDDQFATAIAHIEALVATLRTGDPVPARQLDYVREVAARRVHQGVPLESCLHASRLWATICWEAILTLARIDSPDEREAALEIAGVIAGLANRILAVATHAYLDEITDRGLLRRDLLDALLAAKGDDRATLRLAQRLHLRLEHNYIVVVIRGNGIEVEESREQSPAARSRLDHLVQETRRHVQPSAGALLTGMRNADLVLLYPIGGPGELDAVRGDCESLAAALDGDLSIGMSGYHEGRRALGLAYSEAKDAVAVASRLGIRGRAVTLDEVLVSHMLEASPSARRLLGEAVAPVIAYDDSRRGALMSTLRTYFETRLNITRTAAALFVNPNTVVYRLRRVRDISGRDPHDIDDLFVLFLAVKLLDLRENGDARRG